MSEEKKYQICTRCVMDTTAEGITFDENGVCSFCRMFDNEIKPKWIPNNGGESKLQEILNTVKEAGRNREYDCIIGLSGGTDSSYVTYLAKKKWGLRPLVFHVDAGWNTEIATRNIENLVKKLDIDLFTYVVDWEEMRDLQLAFLKSGVVSQDIPQDHVFCATLYKYISQYNIKYVLTGYNYATESILPSSWAYNSFDRTHVKGIHKRFGTIKLRTFPTISFLQRYLYYPFIKGVKIIRPLNYIPYSKSEALKTLGREIGWGDYGTKHGESVFTKFFQTYFLPERFGYDKRKAHLSSLILSGQITRERALKELQSPPCDPKEAEELKIYVAKKLGISVRELERFMTIPKKTYRDFPNEAYLLDLFKFADRLIGRRPVGI